MHLHAIQGIDKFYSDLKETYQKASLDIARNMKSMGFLAEQIQAVTGLSSETIAEL